MIKMIIRKGAREPVNLLPLVADKGISDSDAYMSNALLRPSYCSVNPLKMPLAGRVKC